MKSDIPHIHYAKVVRVVDGDTIVCDIDLDFHVTMRETFRLAGINTPERGEEGYKEAKDSLTNYLFESNKVYKDEKPLVLLRSYKPYKNDKYQRWIVDVQLIETEENRHEIYDAGIYLVAKGLATVYIIR